MNEFSNEEIGILVDALDAWVMRKQSGDLMVGLLTALVAKDDPSIKAKQAEEKRISEMERKLDSDTATLLKAKLIKLRQKAIA